MKYKFIFTESYNKKARKFFKKHPSLIHLIQIYQKTLKLLELNPKHPSLRLHSLKGKLEGLYSISMNIKFRIAFEFFIKDHEILLINIGDHSTYKE